MYDSNGALSLVDFWKKHRLPTYRFWITFLASEKMVSGKSEGKNIRNCSATLGRWLYLGGGSRYYQSTNQSTSSSG